MFDVIGDIHGQYDKLVALLRHLGYRESSGTWRHPDRTAIFVGDLVDRGPKQLATVELVRGMVEAGAAQCLLGNHEFNAIAWITADPAQPGKFLRPHGKPGNFEQHRAFLTEVEGTRHHHDIIAWFKTLPLWLDLGDLRIVHACWDQPSIDLLQRKMGSSNCLSDEMVLFGNRRGHSIFAAIETLCKGPEVTLPPGVFFKDSGGKVRNEVRVRWWQQDLSTYRKAAQAPMAEAIRIPDLPMPLHWQRPAYHGPPVLFGHYWFEGTPKVISPQFACLDFSAAREGPLVAYRWDGERELSSEKLTWVADELGDSARISFADLVMHVAQPEQCVDCERRLSGEDFGRQWQLCKFCAEAVCESCGATHYCEKQRSMNPHKLR